MIHIQLEEIKRVFPMLAEEIQAGRSIVIEHQGQTFAYMKSPNKNERNELLQQRKQIVQQMRQRQTEIQPNVTLDDVLNWLDEGRL